MLFAPVFRFVQRIRAHYPPLQRPGYIGLQCLHHPGVSVFVRDRVGWNKSQGECRPETMARVVSGVAKYEHQFDVPAGQPLQALLNEFASDSLSLRTRRDGQRGQYARLDSPRGIPQ